MRRNRLTALAALLVLGVPATARAQTFWDFLAVNPGNTVGPSGPGGACGVGTGGPGAGRCDATNGAIAGNDATITRAGQGTVGFNAIPGQAPAGGGTYLTVFQWFADQAVSGDERGVGVCRTDVVAAKNGSPCAPGAGGEIGESNEGNDAQWLILDMSGLTAGSILNSITLSSLTSLEAYRFRLCTTQGQAEALTGLDPACTEYSGNSSANILTVAVAGGDQLKRWGRFQAGFGSPASCAGPTCHGDYLLQGITTTVSPEPGTMGLLATGLVALAGAGTLRRRNRKNKK